CLLRDAVSVIAGVEDLTDAVPEAGARLAGLQRFVDDADGTCALVTTGDGIPVTSALPIVRVGLQVPPATVRREVWDVAVGADAPALAGPLERAAVRYRMGIGSIAAVVAAGRAAARARDRALEAGDLTEGVRATIGNRFGELAQRLDVPHRWEDL